MHMTISIHYTHYTIGLKCKNKQTNLTLSESLLLLGLGELRPNEDYGNTEKENFLHFLNIFFLSHKIQIQHIFLNRNK